MEQNYTERLVPGSWTEDEADALVGRRVSFHKGGTGTVRDAVAMTNDRQEICLYAVDVTPDGGVTILLSKDDMQAGDWAFSILPDAPLSRAELDALPAWGEG